MVGKKKQEKTIPLLHLFLECAIIQPIFQRKDRTTTKRGLQMAKIQFEIKHTYEVEVPDDMEYSEAIDYVSYNGYELVANGEATETNESIGDVNFM